MLTVSTHFYPMYEFFCYRPYETRLYQSFCRVPTILCMIHTLFSLPLHRFKKVANSIPKQHAQWKTTSKKWCPRTSKMNRKLRQKQKICGDHDNPHKPPRHIEQTPSSQLYKATIYHRIWGGFPTSSLAFEAEIVFTTTMIPPRHRPRPLCPI